ncbi:hypothetical protein [Salinimicrobium terrae]|uniref:hypothetical protein n=1 Tax=Salinimicrobium terrae TaxID=470866 RepID=UPI0003FDAB07|nr:hypothetical protein [Salinimicrobium terrae]
MEPEKFENNIKKVFGEREIKPSSQSWEQLKQRLEKKEGKKRPYLLWGASAAAIAAIFFILGAYFNAPIASEESQLVEQTPKNKVLEEKVVEPEVIQLATSESGVKTQKSETEKKPSAESPAKNAIFETPFGRTTEEEDLLASEITSEVPEVVKSESELLLAERKPEISEMSPSEVSDLEVEALLLLATAELKSDPAFTINSNELLHQVEYELEQSFRQKVFEVVKEGFSKAKTAVANRDF